METEIPLLETPRLILRPLGSKHVSTEYVAWLNDPDVNTFLESGNDYTLDKLSDYLEQVESTKIHFWAIHLKDGDTHIGNIKVDPISYRNRVGEYGILIGDKNEWGKNYAFEATDRVFRYFFLEELFLRKITLGVVADNVPAVRLYRKLGFIEEGLYRSHALHGDSYRDVIRMAKFNPLLNL